MGTNSVILLAILIFGIAAFIQKERKGRARIRRLREKFPETTLGELVVGDSFIFDLNEDAQVYRVSGKKELNSTVQIQKFMRSDMSPMEKEIHAFIDTKVFFIRHTIPVPGQDAYVEDLAPGDKFQLYVPNAITETGGSMIFCEILEKGFDFDRFLRIDTGDVGRVGRLTKVIFIGHRNDKPQAINQS